MAINETPDFAKMAAMVMDELAVEIADHAQTFFKSSFDNQGFTDLSFIPWVLRMDTDPHKILMKSEALKDSIKITEATKNSVEITAGEGLPYAGIHNTGGTIEVKVTDKMRKFFWAMFYASGLEKWKGMALTKKDSFIINIPQRQYIGDSATLMQDIDEMIIWKIQNVQKQILPK